MDGAVVLALLAEDRDVISYRRMFNNFTGSVLSSVLLQQIIYRAKGKGFEPFYKFKAPCEHAMYTPGDSWVEELGFTVSEFTTALSKIGTKVSKKKNITRADILANESPENLVVFWTDSNRVTWYELNVPLLLRYISATYKLKRNPDLGGDLKRNPDLPEKRNPDLPEKRNPDLQYTETTETPKEPAEFNNGQVVDVLDHIVRAAKQGTQEWTQPSELEQFFARPADHIVSIYVDRYDFEPKDKKRDALLEIPAVEGYTPESFRAFLRDYRWGKNDIHKIRIEYTEWLEDNGGDSMAPVDAARAAGVAYMQAHPQQYELKFLTPAYDSWVYAGTEEVVPDSHVLELGGFKNGNH